MRVVITGIGVISPLGNTVDEFWKNLTAGETGLSNITRFDASSFPCRIGGEVAFVPQDYLGAMFVELTSLSTQFACAAFKLAMEDANITELPTPTDVLIGAGVSNLAPVMEQYQETTGAMEKYIPGNPMLLQKIFIGGPASGIALMAKATGFVSTVATACSSGLNAVGMAYERIKSRKSDLVIAGACDAPLNHLVHSAFSSAGWYSANNDPTGQKPFDRNREKCVPGEGASIFIIESERRARKRGAKIYCEIVGFAAGNENTNELFFIDTSGEAWGKLIERASKGNGATHVNANAISDRMVDEVEAKAIRKGLGKKSAKVSVTSIKGSIGSGLAAAGGFQIAAGARSIETGIVPPTLNHSESDPQIDLHVITKSTKLNPESILINSHGVTGYNSVLNLKRYRI